MLRGAFWKSVKAISKRARAVACNQIEAQLSPRNYDLYHEPNYLPLPNNLPTVVTIHDLSVFLYPQWHPAKRIDEFEKGFGKMLGETAHFITMPSAFAGSSWIISTSRLTKSLAWHPGIGAHFGPRPPHRVSQALHQFGLAPGYFLSVGAIEPRKNLLMAMQAYCELRPRCVSAIRLCSPTVGLELG